jgi:hypothetical protein
LNRHLISYLEYWGVTHWWWAMGEPEYIDNLGVGLPPPTDLPKEAVITGRVVKIEDTYAREMSVGKGLVAVVLAAAVVARAVIALLALVVRAQPGATDTRGWKALCKGPEFRVTPVWIQDTDGLFVEVEVHGYLSGRALRRRDRVQVFARRQDGRHLPMRAHRIQNLTIGRRIVSRRPSMWTHLGPSMLIQAAFGAVVVATLASCLWGAG